MNPAVAIPEPLIVVHRLSAGFESTVVFRRLTFEVPATGATAVMGPAGVGKSTLLRTLGRWNERRPSFWVHGKIEYLGTDLLEGLDVEEAQRRVCLLAQRARLFTATVLENAIADVAGGRALTHGEKHRLAREALEPWGLWDELASELDSRVTSLSIARQRMLSIARLAAGGARCILADEPLRDVAEAERDDLIRFFAEVKQRMALLMVTHDQRVARAIADTVCLVTAGMLIETTRAGQFFEQPTTELGRQYLRSGNCWPAEPLSVVSCPAASPDDEGAEPDPEPDVGAASPKPSWAPTAEEAAPRPGGFHWVVPDLLGGMQYPGLITDEETDLSGLARLGVRHLVTLTEDPYASESLVTYGIVGEHFPIEDMGVPALAAAADLCRRISRWMQAGEPTVVHCKAGLGRTGTILACTLVVRGLDPVRAVAEVRLVNPRYIQSDVQLAFVEELGVFLSGEPA